MRAASSVIGVNAPETWLNFRVDDVDWHIDADFLGSRWSCIWDRGCAGIEPARDPEGGLGCCSVGAELFDEDEAMRVAALAATISPEHFQYKAAMTQSGPFAEERTALDRRNTRVVDGACVFLNRPGFEGGHGCALHAEAVRSGESPLEWKPSVCWQLPLHIEYSGNVATLRRWQRSDWGADGKTMAWCCTEGEEAYVSKQPVIESLREELVALLGEELVELIAEEID